MKANTKWAIGGVITFVAALVAMEALNPGPPPERAGGDGSAIAAIGSPAPDFSLPHFSTDQPVTLSQYKGQVVLVNFWATWCPPCREEIPDFLSVRKALHPQGFEILGISLDAGGAADVTPFAKEFGITYPILIGNQEVTARYGGIRGIPESFLVDRQGIIRNVWKGAVPRATLEQAIKPLL